MKFQNINNIIVQQRFEAMELLGFETRNKFNMMDEYGNLLAYAAEQQKGIFGFFLRQILGHWRSFELHFFDTHRRKFLKAVHPFRFFFQRLEIFDENDQFIGALQKRFTILSKKFDVEDKNNKVIMTMHSPIWRIWSFPFTYQGKQLAIIDKKWSGLLVEGFTDRDKFQVTFNDESLDEDTRRIILSAAIFVDLQYFEKKE